MLRSQMLLLDYNKKYTFSENTLTPECKVSFLNKMLYNIVRAKWRGNDSEFPPISKQWAEEVNDELKTAYTANDKTARAEILKFITYDTLDSDGIDGKISDPRLKINTIYTQKYRDSLFKFLLLMSLTLNEKSESIPAWYLNIYDILLNNIWKTYITRYYKNKSMFLPNDEKRYLEVREQEERGANSVSEIQPKPKKDGKIQPDIPYKPRVFNDDALWHFLDLEPSKHFHNEDEKQDQIDMKKAPKRGDAEGDVSLSSEEEAEDLVSFETVLADWLKNDAIARINTGEEEVFWPGEDLWKAIKALYTGEGIEESNRLAREENRFDDILFPFNSVQKTAIKKACYPYTPEQLSDKNGADLIGNTITTLNAKSLGILKERKLSIINQEMYNYWAYVADINSLLKIDNVLPSVKNFLKEHPDSFWNARQIVHETNNHILKTFGFKKLQDGLKSQTPSYLKSMNIDVDLNSNTYRYLPSGSRNRVPGNKPKPKHKPKHNIINSDDDDEPTPGPGPSGAATGWVLHSPLYPWQQRNLDRFNGLRAKKMGMLLADKPGMGKTISALACLCSALQGNAQGRAIILVPPIIISQWKNQVLTKTGIPPGIVVTPDDGSVTAKLKSSPLLFICTPETYASRTGKIVRKGRDADMEWANIAPFDFVIIDEVQKYRGNATKPGAYAQTILALCEATLKLDGGGVLLLSGTPISSGYSDLLPIARLINAPSEQKNPSFWNNKDTVRQNLAEVKKWFIANEPPEYPRTTTDVVTVPLEELQEQKLKQLAEQGIQKFQEEGTVKNTKKIFIAQQLLIAGFDPELANQNFDSSVNANDTDSEDEGEAPQAESRVRMVESKSPTALILKIIDICERLRKDVQLEGEGTWQSEYYAKDLDGAQKLIRLPNSGARPRKVIVFSKFPNLSLAVLASFFTKAGIKTPEIYKGGDASRAAILARFKNDPNTPYLFMSMSAGGAGIELQEASAVVYIDAWWTKAEHDQATARVCRMGQTRDVRVAYVLTDPSISLYNVTEAHRRQGDEEETLRKELQLDANGIYSGLNEGKDVGNRDAPIYWLREKLNIQTARTRRGAAAQQAPPASAGGPLVPTTFRDAPPVPVKQRQTPAPAATAPAPPNAPAPQHDIIDLTMDDDIVPIGALATHMKALNLYFKP